MPDGLRFAYQDFMMAIHPRTTDRSSRSRHARTLIVAPIVAGMLVGSGLLSAQKPPVPAGSAVLALQVLLDRAHYSPGEIDGARGANTARALKAFAEANKLPAATAERKAAELLGGGEVQTLASYLLTDADMAGPFIDAIPTDMMALAALPGLHYTSVLEALGERFHTSPRLLKSLNRTARFVVGEEIQVPNVGGVAPPSADRSARIVVSKRASTLMVTDAEGRFLFFAPVTSGSSHDPLPLGTWAVTGVARNPSFNYNPELFWDADPSHGKAKIPPGPNNPVGSVWIDITRPHYGLHGTPHPEQVGHTSSHGCVRLTNWDAQTVAGLVRPGTRVDFVE